MKQLKIKGARMHNLKNISIDIPRNKFIIFTGLSGSGKSSLAFDTIYAEGQRRYVESLSTYARQFISNVDKPDVDLIEGLSPSVAIEQKSTSHNPRSTVGTITEIYDYLRLLFARIGIPSCPEHNIELKAQTITQIVNSIITLPEQTKAMLLAPIVVNRKGEYKKLLSELSMQGYTRARINNSIVKISDMPQLDPNKKHNIEIVVDRFKIRKKIASRLSESVQTALELSGGIASVVAMEEKTFDDVVFSNKYACIHCGYSLSELEPRLFSFNSPVGACKVCDGIGVKEIIDINLVVANPNLSLAEGAIYGWGQSNYTKFHQLKILSKHYKFDTNTSFKLLTDEQKNIILFGSKDIIDFSKVDSMYGSFGKKKFEGIYNYMQRKYNETSISYVKENLRQYVQVKKCYTCQGSRLNELANNVFIEKHNIYEICNYNITNCLYFFKNIKIEGQRAIISEKILKEIIQRLTFLLNIGLGYLNLNRKAGTLSGGEAQRIRLASQIGAGLVGVLYVLDEPSIGLHQRDNKKLLQTLFYLKKLGNTVIVVEHDKEAIESADWIVDIGPGAGVHGGQIVASGDIKTIIKAKNSLTSDYLSGKKSISVPKKRDTSKQWLIINGASCNNLKNINMKIPVGIMTCITGVSGSGKSSLINHTLYPLAAKILNNAYTVPGAYKSYSGFEFFEKVINIDQKPIGRTPRSNPVTYTGVFTLIREIFSQTIESRARGYKLGRFSFNIDGGRCIACKGDGLIRVSMHFLSDVYVNCDICKGKRYNNETLQITYKNKNIADVLNMTIEDAYNFFMSYTSIAKKLKTLIDVGLSYITLGQNATTLSGGEAQRIKLAKELAKPDDGKNLYILDEPTTGLHFHDIAQLLSVLKRLKKKGNTLVVIEHNLDVIKIADWIIDIGPEGGDEGGEIIAYGTPEYVIKVKKSHTAVFLKPLLK